MIEIKHLYKRYHNHHGSDWILKDINLIIPEGVSVGLIGANGAGKSTLLRLIAGMDSPDRGEVIRHTRVSWPVGLSGGMQASMTGRQNVKFVARVQGYNSKKIQDVIRFVEDFAEIGEAFDEPVKTYSSGMRSRLSFGLSLAFDFDVYISDEATAVGDRAFKDKAKQLFKEKVGQASLIMVSHGEGILRDLCQAGIYLKEGKAYWYDDIEEAILAYHKDVDDYKRALIADDKASMSTSMLKTDPAQLNKAQVMELQKQLKEARQHMNGIRQRLHQARHEKWSKEEISVLSQLRKAANDEVVRLAAVLNKTSLGARRNCMGKIHQAQLSIRSFTLLLSKAESEEWSLSEIKTIKKSLEIACVEKANAEAKLQDLDGFE